MVYAQKAHTQRCGQTHGRHMCKASVFGDTCRQGVTATLVRGTEVHLTRFCGGENMGPEAGPGSEPNSASFWL